MTEKQVKIDIKKGYTPEHPPAKHVETKGFTPENPPRRNPSGPKKKE